MGSPYEAAVQARLADKENQTGHKQSSERIVAEASEELVDVTGWLRGLFYDQLLPKEQELVDRIEAGAQELWHDSERLRDSLGKAR